MILPSSMTTAAAEVLAGSLGGAAAPATLVLPTRGRHQHAGGEPAFVQALATWANTVPIATIETYATTADDIQIDRLTRRLHGLAASLLADRIISRANVDLTAPVRERALARLDELQAPKPPAGASRGPQVEMLCADHTGRSHPAALYDLPADQAPAVKRLPQFNDFVRKILLPTIVPYELRQAMDPGTAQALGVALHELFRNTDEHGREDDNGDARRKSIRGIQARRLSVEPGRLAEFTAESPPLARYAEGLRPARAGNRDIQLIELSVLDSGPGMAASLAGRPSSRLSVQQEMELATRCFREHVSRKQSATAGLGLPNVVQALRRQKGFLRVRTGRIALYSDLSQERRTDFGTPPVLRSWTDGRPEEAPVVGTAFTLIFPLEV